MSMDRLVRREVPLMSHQRYVYDEQNKLIRYQSSLLSSRYSILLRHPMGDHFCGYTLASPEDESLYGQYLADHPVTFCGFANRHVCWRESQIVNEQGVRRQIHRHQHDDYWIGFDFMLQPVPTVEQAITELQRFETAYWNLINNAKDDPTV